jgi:hypothetical protein
MTNVFLYYLELTLEKKGQSLLFGMKEGVGQDCNFLF